jgi:hypothetical protein
MKHLNLAAILLMLVIGLCSAPAALAGTIVAGDWIQLKSYNIQDSGGIMHYAVSQYASGANPFYLDTFCIQDNTYITVGVWYQIKSITDQVGPYAPPHDGEGTLIGAVDYLFYQYWAGRYNAAFGDTTPDAVTHVAFGLERQADFQRLLWKLQGTGDTQYLPVSGTAWLADLTTYNNNTALQHQWWRTEVLNIVDSNGQDVQNQLYHVPEPSLLILLGIGISGFALLGWRFKD